MRTMKKQMDMYQKEEREGKNMPGQVDLQRRRDGGRKKRTMQQKKQRRKRNESGIGKSERRIGSVSERSSGCPNVDQGDSIG